LYITHNNLKQKYVIEVEVGIKAYRTNIRVSNIYNLSLNTTYSKMYYEVNADNIQINCIIFERSYILYSK